MILTTLMVLMAGVFRPGKRAAGIIGGVIIGAIVGGAFIIGGRQSGTPAGSQPETLELTMPPASFVTAEGAWRQGLGGSTLQGCYVAIPGKGSTPDAYFYFTHSDGARQVGIDPGEFDAALAGYVGHEVQLSSGNRTAAQVAAHLDAAIEAAGIYASADTTSATTTIVGDFDAETVFTGGSYDVAGGGTISAEVPGVGRVVGFTHLTQNASFTPTTACSKLRPADIPATPFRVTGFRVKWGTSHTGQVQVAVYQGGSGYDYQGASLLGRLGVTTGSATSAWVDVLTVPGDVLLVDPSLGGVWVCWMGDGATSPFAFFSSTGAGVGAASDYDHDVSASNNAIWTLSGTPPTGSGGTFPSTLPARGAASAFKPGIQLVLQLPPYYGDLAWKSRVGIMIVHSMTGSSAMTGVFTSNAFTLPNVLGMEVDRGYVNYAAHDAGEQFRVEWWEGGSADNNIATATKVWDAGQTTGTATGWVPLVAAGSNPLTASARMWMSVKALSGTSNIRFGGGGIGYGDANNPAAYYGSGALAGNATESEYVSPDAGFSHDPSVATTTPFAPVGSNVNNSNSAGLYGIVRVPGYAAVANP